MTDAITKQKVDRLLKALETQEPTAYELGTPQLVETSEVRELVGLGAQIVPYLIERTKSETPKVVAYIVFVLGKLGDPTAIEPLRKLRTQYQADEPKTEWLYAVIGQCNLTIAALE